MIVSIENFRSFGNEQSFELKPLTILVGENSSGKSSFLAAVRYLITYSNSRNTAGFNEEPFYLGGFKNISHYRGRRGASTFSLSISAPIKHSSSIAKRQLSLFPNDNGEPLSDLGIQLFFESAGDEAVVNSVKLKSNLFDLSIERVEGRMKLIAEFDNEKFVYEPNRYIGLSDYESIDMSVVEYVLRTTQFSLEREPGSYFDERESAKLSEFCGYVRRSLQGSFMRPPRVVRTLAPIRTKPQRSYDPTMMSKHKSSDGDDLILTLGRIARSGEREWEQWRQALSRFGQSSGLFSDIKVKKFGSLESDPFQILVKVDGRESNITDVGYGVSQSLPLFLLLNQKSRGTDFLLQQPEVHLHPRAQAAMGSILVESLKKRRTNRILVETHSDYIINRVRQHIRSGDISSRDVSLIYFSKDKYDSIGSEINFDRNGNIVSAPNGYRDFFLDEEMRTLGIDP